jgi:hypothetical protein
MSKQVALPIAVGLASLQDVDGLMLKPLKSLKKKVEVEADGDARGEECRLMQLSVDSGLRSIPKLHINVLILCVYEYFCSGCA